MKIYFDRKNIVSMLFLLLHHFNVFYFSSTVIFLKDSYNDFVKIIFRAIEDISFVKIFVRDLTFEFIPTKYSIYHRFIVERVICSTRKTLECVYRVKPMNTWTSVSWQWTLSMIIYEQFFVCRVSFAFGVK